MEENDIDGVVDVVDAREVEAQVAREQGQVRVRVPQAFLEIRRSQNFCSMHKKTEKIP
jgi:hypothetical protein